MAVRVKVVALKGRPYAARWYDPATGGERQQSLGTRDRAEAERLAGELGERLSLARPAAELSWSDLVERFAAERMPAMSAGSRETYGVTFKLFGLAVGA